MKVEEHGVELIDYLRVIRKRKGLIVASTLAFVFATVTVSLFLPRVYKASVTFLLEESKIPKESAAAGVNPFIIETFGKTYEVVIKNNKILGQVVKHFKLDEKPYELSIRELSELISVRTLGKSKLLRLDAEFREPQMAKDIANFMADKAVELNTTISRTDTTLTKDFIKNQVDMVKQELDRAESKLEQFKANAHLAALKKKAETLLARSSDVKTELSRAQSAIAENEELLKKTEEELSKREKTIKLTRKLAEDPLYQQSLAQQSGSSSVRQDLNMIVEEVNPVHQALEMKVVDLKPKLSSLYARLNYLQTEFKNNTSELNAVQEELVGKEMELERLERSHGLTNEAYKLFFTNMQEATLNVASKTQELKILDQAILPDRPVRPKRLLMTLIAGIVGLIVSIFLAFIAEYFEKVKESEAAA